MGQVRVCGVCGFTGARLSWQSRKKFEGAWDAEHDIQHGRLLSYWIGVWEREGKNVPDWIREEADK